ncbi:MAG: 4-hydroxy-tetrahydrodipicolinate reductase [Myxococcales bacterium]|nr:4-hydroxy-tetrahydrodipicolinate reductase [Myxococcales bacterium]
MKLCVFGAGGRMGQSIIRLAAESSDVELVGAVELPGSPCVGRDAGELSGARTLGVAVCPDLASGLLGADVLVDFSTAAAFSGMLRIAEQKGVGVVSGTTLLAPADEALIARASERIAVLWAPNMSVGVTLLAELVRRAVLALGEYDVEIIESHHNKKTDAPSGTATYLQAAAQAARPELRVVHGRSGDVGARAHDELGMHALRGGGIVGDHSVHLVGEFERVELTHRAMGRELFAAGALRAARFLARQPAGRYTLLDMLDRPSAQTP